VKISRKESKESRYWLNLIELHEDKELIKERDFLVNESSEFIKIFTSILSKTIV
jgi:hypothetical protein